VVTPTGGYPPPKHRSNAGVARLNRIALSAPQYASIDRPEFDELFEADGRVVAAYTLNLHRQDGSSERMAVMAVWTVSDDGKVTVLREVDAPAA
jgi:hypothetical protein